MAGEIRCDAGTADVEQPCSLVDGQWGAVNHWPAPIHPALVSKANAKPALTLAARSGHAPRQVCCLRGLSKIEDC